MIKTMIAFTEEVDDPEYAAEDILRQLDFGSLLKETVGIVYCHNDFVDTGVLRAVLKNLPFTVVGTSTIASSVNASDNSLILALFVMTSDDVNFRTITIKKLDGTEKQLRDAAEVASADMGGRNPALVLVNFPLMSPYSADWLLRVFTDIFPSVPMFGTLAVTLQGGTYEKSFVFIDGEADTQSCTAILMYGDVRPKFFIGTISEEKFAKSRGIVTGVANGKILQTVNDTKAMEYMKNLGLSTTPEGGLLLPELFPLVIDYGDGTHPVLRAMVKDLEDGSIVLAGDVPVGADISLTSIDTEEVRTATEKTLQTVEDEKGGYDVVLLHSCLARYYVLMELDPDLELTLIREHLKDAAKYIISYSAGEICPVVGQDNTLTNRLHNYTLIACAF
jgi:hypothetical protein